MEKVIKNNLTIISKPHAHPHTMKKTCKVSKRSVKNCKRSCAHKTPMVNVDGRTDERTDGQTETCTPKSPMLKQVRQTYRLEPRHDKTYKISTSNSSDQTVHSGSLISVFSVRMDNLWDLGYPYCTRQSL